MTTTPGEIVSLGTDPDPERGPVRRYTDGTLLNTDRHYENLAALREDVTSQTRGLVTLLYRRWETAGLHGALFKAKPEECEAPEQQKSVRDKAVNLADTYEDPAFTAQVTEVVDVILRTTVAHQRGIVESADRTELIPGVVIADPEAPQ